nr:hypothetical protein [Marinicella sp. W31]MDC2878128.1 hypothetical protein [Marinicella sp. W31]
MIRQRRKVVRIKRLPVFPQANLGSFRRTAEQRISEITERNRFAVPRDQRFKQFDCIPAAFLIASAEIDAGELEHAFRVVPFGGSLEQAFEGSFLGPEPAFLLQKRAKP